MKVFISPVHYFMDRKFYGSEVEESFFFFITAAFPNFMDYDSEIKQRRDTRLQLITCWTCLCAVRR